MVRCIVGVIGVTTCAGCAGARWRTTGKGDGRRPVPHMITEYARLKATPGSHFPGYIDVGRVSGSIDMMMRLDFNDILQSGTYTATTSDGTIRGTVVVSRFVSRETGDRTIYEIVGHATVSGGTGAYARSRARNLKVSGEVTSEGRLNMSMSGALAN